MNTNSDVPASSRKARLDARRAEKARKEALNSNKKPNKKPNKKQQQINAVEGDGKTSKRVKRKVTSVSRIANVDGITGIYGSSLELPTPVPSPPVPSPPAISPQTTSPQTTSSSSSQQNQSLKSLSPSSLLSHLQTSPPSTPSDLSYTIVTCLNLLRTNNALTEVEGEKLNFKGKIMEEIREIVRGMIEERESSPIDQIQPVESLKIIKSYIRNDLVPEAIRIMDRELSSDSAVVERSSALSILSTKYYDVDDYANAESTIKELETLGPKVRLFVDAYVNDSANSSRDASAFNLRIQNSIDWKHLIQSSSKCESRRRSSFKNGRLNGADLQPLILSKGGKSNVVFSVLRALTTHPAPNTDGIYEALANALVRRVTFLKGSVSMSTLPPPDRGEVAFIGRSNVGKSSLVNMICNRKALAYTSKRPGKTREFNFFSVNDKVDIMKEVKYGDEVRGVKDFDCFYIVDLPGFGFAKVSREQKDEWSKFQKEYFESRKNLRVVFHLIDSRHGLVSEDERIMKECSEIFKGKKDVSYVIILTKADKNDSTGRGKVSKTVMESVRNAMRENGVGSRPIITTSAETKYGRDGVWTYLKEAFNGGVNKF
ncbi:hypothetical protein TrVE_jg12985 [Triparma verrucosa]|uniref:EngB-type G domain-containing protein n=1 Tax=Triparma verrucosa TaxID=1606542 RepID=A0A9W7EM35_9STRA|nr:hypothetical protein TrVE_jg12985 [Triparma verrucosa]